MAIAAERTSQVAINYKDQDPVSFARMNARVQALLQVRARVWEARNWRERHCSRRLEHTSASTFARARSASSSSHPCLRPCHQHLLNLLHML